MSRSIPVWLALALGAIAAASPWITMIIQGWFSGKRFEHEEKLQEQRLSSERIAQHVDRVIPAYAAVLEAAYRCIPTPAFKAGESVRDRNIVELGYIDDFLTKAGSARVFADKGAKEALDQMRTTLESFTNERWDWKRFDNGTRLPTDTSAEPLRSALAHLEAELARSLADWRFGSANPNEPS